MKRLTALSIIISLMSHTAFAVEVSPTIGFKQAQKPNDRQFNAKDSLNSKIFTQNDALEKAIPDINSVGLDFTFKMD